MSNNNLKSKEDLQKMMALSEEINTLNIKVKQLVEDLSSTQDVLGSVQELAGQLTGKVGEFERASNSYVPPQYDLEDKKGTPSYESAGVTRERIMPTPETIHDYQPQNYSTQPVSQPIQEKSPADNPVGGGSKGTARNITGKQDLIKNTKAKRVQRGKKASAPKGNSRPPKKGWGFGSKDNG